MDNKQFNVNGETKELLLETLKLAFKQHWEGAKAAAYIIDKEKGFVLLWDRREDSVRLPADLLPEALIEMIWAWLKSDNVLECSWDADADHDGSNEPGWRVYCEDWGHIKLSGTEAGRYAIIAVKPAWMWYGK
jgi:hypothetical protein